jgi:hypothetical protein
MKLKSDWADYSKNYTRTSLQDSFKGMNENLGSFLRSIPLEKYFWKPDDFWSVEQNVKHLTKSTSPISFSIILPKLTFLIFGRGGVSRDFERLVNDYREQLRISNHAGFFQPFTMSASGSEDTKEKQIESLLKLYNDIVSALSYWKEDDLDEYRMPHPILGFVTIREMLFFTIYHQYHHLSIVSDRLYKS